MTAIPILVTGFEPFAGLDRNPSAEVALRLDGKIVGGGKVAARLLPVSLAAYRGALAAALDEVRPGLVIALGLAEREATVRIERVGVNIADFEIADNDGTVAAGRQLEAAGPQARFSTLPSAAIEAALLAEESPRIVRPRPGPICATPVCTASLAWRRRPSFPSTPVSSICPTCQTRSRS